MEKDTRVIVVVREGKANRDRRDARAFDRRAPIGDVLEWMDALEFRANLVEVREVNHVL